MHFVTYVVVLSISQVKDNVRKNIVLLNLVKNLELEVRMKKVTCEKRLREPSEVTRGKQRQ